jgi:triphosphatase
VAEGREVELKLEIGAADAARLLRHPRLRELAAGRPRSRRLWNVYFDTDELGLWRNGLVLRVRAAGRRRIAGVKTHGEVRGGLVAREEVERPLPGPAADPRRIPETALLAAIGEPRLRSAVEKAANGEKLVPRVATDYRRTTLPLQLGTARIELALDVGETRAGRSRIPIQELELELLSGPTRALFDVALLLAADLELRPAPLGKSERGFVRLLGEETAPVRAERIELPDGATLDLVLRAVLGECMRHWADNQPAVENGDAEGVHQMRVGVRRLRSALRLFREWLPVREREALNGELRWLAGVLGRVRDVDVFLDETLGPMLADRPEDAGLAALHEAARTAREDALAELHAALQSRRHAVLLLRLGRLVETIASGRSAAQLRRVRAEPEARRLLRHLAERLFELGEKLDQLSLPELHRLRIRAKRLRYAVELLGPLFAGKAAGRAARRLSDLQDALGHLQDLASAEAQIRALRERGGAAASPETLRAEGFVLGYAARSSAAGRAALTRAWRRVTHIRPFWRD